MMKICLTVLSVVVAACFGMAPVTALAADPDYTQMVVGCDRDNADACYNLGLMYWTGKVKGITDMPAARDRFDKSCRLGNKMACGILGIMMYEGQGGSVDKKGARYYLKAGCDNGDWEPCKRLGMGHLKGEFDPSDVAEGVAVLGDLCRREVKGTCYPIGVAILNGIYVENDGWTRTTRLKNACYDGLKEGCFEAARWYLTTTDTEHQDYDWARSALTNLCDKSFMPACTLLGQAVFEGRGGPRDDAAARGMFGKACDGGDIGGCMNLGIMLRDGVGGPTDRGSAEKAFKKACDKGEPEGCAGMATMLAERGDMSGMKSQLPELERLCGQGYGDSCYQAGMTLLNDKSSEQARKKGRHLLEKGCEAGVGESCFEAAMAFKNAVGGPQSASQAREYANTGCEAECAEACVLLGKFWDKGFGGPKDGDEAKMAYDAACDLGLSEGCDPER